MPICACNCGATTSRQFAPGHDAKYVSLYIVSVLAGSARPEDFGRDANGQMWASANLRVKFENALVRAQERREAQATRPALGERVIRKSSKTAANRERAQKLQESLNRRYWTGQVGHIEVEGYEGPLVARVLNYQEGIVTVSAEVPSGAEKLFTVPKEDFQLSNSIDD